MYLIYIIVVYLVSLCDSNAFPHIFNNLYANCEYYNHSFPENYKKFEVINKLWEIKLDQHDNSSLFLSPCQMIESEERHCDNGAACLIKPTGTGVIVINYGKYFKFKLSDNRRTLVSEGGGVCTPTESYSATIEFDCDQDIPSYRMNGCKLYVKLLEPKCKPFCKLLISGNVIDLTPLQKLASINVQSDKQSFELGFCKRSEKCSEDVSICETNGKTSISNVDSQDINYDVNENRLILKGQSGSGKKKVLAEIHIKCSRTAWQITNAKALSNSSTRKYYFEVESLLACVKLPLQCLITQSPFVYNLTNLHRSDGWAVQNVTNGSMKINMCGNLNLKKGDNVCEEQSSQVCLELHNNYINLGSTPSKFLISDEGIVKGSFVDGSTCLTNRNRLYSTEIEFKCHSIEEGPFLLDVADCIYKLEWKTPAACPIYLNTGTGCTLEDQIAGNLNLNDVHTSNDRKYFLSDTSHLRYNLCGSLSKPCNNDTDVSVCLIKNGKEFALGYKSTSLIREGLSLQMHLEGDRCNDKRTSAVKVNFKCNSTSSKEGEVVATQVRENCLYEINVTTSLACYKPEEVKCTIENYDLSPLMKNNSNYVITDNSTNLKYILNVCRSLTDTLCLRNSGACLVNLQEPLFKLKYKSLGVVNSLSVPVIENGSLVIDYTGYCMEPGVMKTRIRFACSENEEPPYLFKNDSCFYEFLWKTQHACPKLKPVEHVQEKTVKSTVSPNEIVKNVHTSAAKENISIPSFDVGSSKHLETEWPINTTPFPKTHQSTIRKDPVVVTMKPVTTVKKKYNCLITNKETSVILNSSTINAVNISSSSDDNYTIAIDKPSFTCDGLICHNNKAIISTDVCPVVQVNYSISAVKLLYQTEYGDWHNIEVWLKCGTSEAAHVAREVKSTIVFIYPTKSVCPLLQKPTSNAGIAIGVPSGLLVMFLSAGSFIIFKKYRSKYKLIGESSSTSALNMQSVHDIMKLE